MDRKSIVVPSAGSPDPINAGLNLDLGRFFSRSWKRRMILTIFQGKRIPLAGYINFKPCIGGDTCISANRLNIWIYASECCPEQPGNPTSPAAHPSSVFCDDLLQHIKIWRVHFRFILRWDELSLLFLGLWPVVNSPLLSPWLNFSTETTRRHFFGN